MNEELGVLVQLDEESGDVARLPVHPMTREQADEYTLATLQSYKFRNDIDPAGMSPLYWVPLSAFQPVGRTGAEPMTEAVARGTDFAGLETE